MLPLIRPLLLTVYPLLLIILYRSGRPPRGCPTPLTSFRTSLFSGTILFVLWHTPPEQMTSVPSYADRSFLIFPLHASPWLYPAPLPIDGPLFSLFGSCSFFE